MQGKQSASPVDRLTFGLDIGIASVGWAVLEHSGENEEETSRGRIVDLGVRTFDAAEKGDTGEPLNLARRTARTMRKRLARRVQRLKKLRRLLRDAGIVPDADETHFVTPPHGMNPWLLRAEGLDRRLSAEEWARTLYHLVKHRGFYAARKTEESDDGKSEGGKLTAGVRRTQALFAERNYRAVGEMVARDEAFAGAKRNKEGDYKNSFYRKLLREELALLFERQRALGNPYTDTDLHFCVDELFWTQRPACSGGQLLQEVGKCTFEKDEYRAAKNTWSAERFVWLTRLNNLRIDENGVRRGLNEAERTEVIDLPYTRNKVEYRQVRKALDLPPHVTFAAGVDYFRKGDKAEEEKLFEAKAFHALRKAYERHGLELLWQKRRLDPHMLDTIATCLSVYKTDAELRRELAQAQCEAAEIEALLEVSFTGFINLSLKALRKILPCMESGRRYDEACADAGYNHSPLFSGGALRKLPLIAYDEIRNPVVYRALNQARKVVNALIGRYGSPCAIHIELARDLSKPFDERRKIEREQKAFADRKQQLLKEFWENFPHVDEPKAKNLGKYRMYKEQHGKCAFSLEPIDLGRLLEQGYVEEEHILPYSRSFDDTQNNKVLAFTRENRNKRNRTPYEYLNGQNDSERWRAFVAWVQGNKSFRQAKRNRLLRKELGENFEKDEFAERNLNDTRFATRFLANFLKRHLCFSDPGNKTPVLTPSGGFTGFLRARWGLLKDREQSDLHHAQDACIVAAASHALIKRVSDYHRKRERHEIIRGGYMVDATTGEILREAREHFPEPWDRFREEIQARLRPDPATALQALPHYNEEYIRDARPVWVSRAPKRRNRGALHQETIRSAKYLAESKSVLRTPLENLKLSHLSPLKENGKPNEETLVGLEDPRNAKLVEALYKRLEAFDGDGKKAFAAPFHKPLSDGGDGPPVRKVKIFSVQKGGVPVRGGIADQASMWRVDVFEKEGKYYLVPIYQSDRRKGAPLPDRAATQSKVREEWTRIDESFDFRFSLCLNDVVRLTTKNRMYFGYFAGLNISTAAINIWSHDRNRKEGKEGLYQSLGVKTGILAFEKLHVDVLGRVFPAKREIRRGLA